MSKSPPSTAAPPVVEANANSLSFTHPRSTFAALAVYEYSCDAAQKNKLVGVSQIIGERNLRLFARCEHSPIMIEADARARTNMSIYILRDCLLLIFLCYHREQFTSRVTIPLKEAECAHKARCQVLFTNWH